MNPKGRRKTRFPDRLTAAVIHKQFTCQHPVFEPERLRVLVAGKPYLYLICAECGFGKDPIAVEPD